MSALSLVERIEALWTLNDAATRRNKAAILADVRELERALRAHEFDCHGYCVTCDGFDVSPQGSTRRAHRKDCTTLAILTKCVATKESI